MGANVRDRIVQDLKNEIARGTVSPGQRLIETSLCERYGVGRTAVREALRHLAHDGFVTIAQNVGAVVRELSQKDIEHIYDLMGNLEGLSVRIGTNFMTEDKIRQLEDLLTEMDDAKDAVQFFRLNYEFHRQLMSLTDNTWLVKFMEILRAQAQRISLRSFFNPGQITASVVEHRKVLEAIRAGNAVKAEKLVRDHYLLSKNRLIKYLNTSL
jgi:DNA-binding GntR family transcriptional regulator